MAQSAQVTQGSNGNTNHSRRRVRNWCFTLNNYTDEDISTLTSLTDAQYMFEQEIAPTTGTEHLQGFIIFKNPRTITGLKRILRSAHWEEMKGTIDQNILYCTKEKEDEEIFTNIEDWKKVAQGTGTLCSGKVSTTSHEEILKKNIEESCNSNLNINFGDGFNIWDIPKLTRQTCYDSDEEFFKDTGIRL